MYALYKDWTLAVTENLPPHHITTVEERKGNIGNVLHRMVIYAMVESCNELSMVRIKGFKTLRMPCLSSRLE